MEMVKAIGLKKYYVTDTYEVHALDGVTLRKWENNAFKFAWGSGCSDRRRCLDPRKKLERYGSRRANHIPQTKYRICISAVQPGSRAQCV